MTRTLMLAMGLLLTLGRASASAWGCEGHQAVAIIAERLLGNTAAAVRAALTASPVEPTLERFCGPFRADVIADVSTWADDVRSLDPSTGPWHFIDFPRALGDNTSNYTPFCAGGNCVIDAIVNQFRVVRTATNPKLKADALRFLIHFVGDLHQPLHAISNGDRGGNCIPVTYFGEAPVEDERGNFAPNLHRVWDTSTIRRFMTTNNLADSRALASRVASTGLPQGLTALTPTTARVKAWARASNRLARNVTYARLPVDPPIDAAAPGALASCAENDHVGRRLAMLHEQVGPPYEEATVPVILSQLRLAGIRLAAVLKAAFPGQ